MPGRINMSPKIVPTVLLCLTLLAAPRIFAQGRGDRGAPPTPKPENAQSLAYIAEAKKLAGTDAFLLHPYNFFCIPANTRANNTAAPELEPVKLFDDLYAVGNSETTVYTLVTTEGILLFDSATRTESSPSSFPAS